MRDHRPVHRAVRIDVESAGTAIEAMGADGKPGLEALRMHWALLLKIADWWTRSPCGCCNCSGSQSSMVEARWPRVFTSGGSRRSRIQCGLHARRRVSVFPVEDYFWRRSYQLQLRILLAKSSPGSRRAPTTSGYLGAGYAFGKGLYEAGWHVRAVGALGRYDYQGTLFGGISPPPS